MEPKDEELVEVVEDALKDGPKTKTLKGTKPEDITTDPKTGLNSDYVVLSDAERAKGFVRPVRNAYRHVGARPKNPLRDLTPQEAERYKEYGYVKFETYPKGGSSGVGRFWTEKQLNSGCGNVTSMGRELSETYARQPSFYGSTYCSTCRGHFLVGAHGEFVWEGTSERVGT